MGDPAVALFLLALGAFFLIASVSDWNFFFTWSRSQRNLVWLVSRKGARILYGAIGIALVAAAGWVAFLGPEAPRSTSTPATEPNASSDGGIE